MAKLGTQIVPLPIGGMWSAGDPSDLQVPYVKLLRNMLPRPGPRFDARPPFTYDGLSGVMGLARWEDLTNQVTRLVACDTSKLYVKDTTSENWNAGTAVGAFSAARLTSHTNFMGKLYAAFDDGSGSPALALSYDGTNVSTAPYNSTIYARSLATFNDRLFLAYPRVTVSPLASVIADAYDWTNTARWVPTNVNITSTTVSSGVTVGRLSPTSTAVNGCSVRSRSAAVVPEAGIITLAASSSETFVVWRFPVRGVDPLYEVPLTLELTLWTFKHDTSAYNVGDIYVSTAADGNTYRYRVTAAGTTGVGVVLGSTKGAPTVDGTVTFLNEGSATLAAQEINVPNISEFTEWSTYFLLAAIPPHTNTTTLTPVLKFYNTEHPALTTLAPIEISLKDGIADGDPRKANQGQQWTLGDFYYPFFNCETATSATLNLDQLIWSEINEPAAIRASSYQRLPEAAGLPTAMAVVSGRLVVFKRRGMWVFGGTSDPDVPILAEAPANTNLGCIGPLAHDSLDDQMFFIGEDEIYRWAPGGVPEGICGDAMREEIMAKGANWVENASTYKMPLLAIDKRSREVWVYTQASKLYCYNIASGFWSTHDHGIGATAAVRTMIYYPSSGTSFFPTSGKMYVSFGGGVGYSLTHLDPATTFKDTIDSNGSNVYTVTSDITLRPLELFSPPRYDAVLEEIGVYHLATAAQTAETLTAYVSFDRGSTFPKSNTVRFAVSAPRIPIPLWQSGASVTVKLSHVGQTGATIWSINKADARVAVKRGEFPTVTPTQVSSSL